MRNRVSSGLVVAIILAAVAFGAGYATRAWTHPTLNDFALVDEALGLLKAHYLRTLPDSLVQQRGMIRGALEALHDPYTLYVEPSGHELETDTLAGEYGGIGAGLIVDLEGAVRLVPTPGGPADQAGVMENDVLLAVDGVAIEEFPGLGDITAAIRGPAGTRVTLNLGPRTAGGDPFEIDVVRAAIDLPSATGYLLPEDETIGVIAVSVFSEKTAQEILREHQDLTDRGATAFVLDLRGNGGGLLDSAVSVSRLFMETGLIVVEHRNDTSERSFSAEVPGELAEAPLVVLVDGGTASAAEVVAAALQQNGRAPLIGTATFGKGSVQVILPLSDGSSLHVTTAEWYTPNGQTLDGVGLAPDILAARADDGSDTALSAARGWLRGQGRGD
jgi:carboxyl-terminal processing protease